MDISDNLAKLFKQEVTTASQLQNTSEISQDSRLQNETYIFYGTRICGKVTASLPTLSAFLHRIFQYELKRQSDDKQLQEEYKRQLTINLDRTNEAIQTSNANISNANNKIDVITENIAELEEQLIEAQNKDGEINKMAKVKMIIGLIILAILTVYLFLFYSSTFYSAFFKEFNTTISVAAAMFDSNAIPNALFDGIGELVFILCAPIIFMGLGYSLHYFSQQSFWTKYLKIACILTVTFIFDCILAYLIAKKIYDIEILSILGDTVPYNLSAAIRDVNVWAVIFCGFIVYIIWGIVFDMTLTAYENLRSNKHEIQNIRLRIRKNKEDLLKEKQNKTQLQAEVDSLASKRQSIIDDLARGFHFDSQIIKTALQDFFAGWMVMMNTLRRPSTAQQEANNIYNTTIQKLFNV